MTVRIKRHTTEEVPDAGSFEVIHPGGSEFFYWDDNPGRRAISVSMTMTQEEAKAAAQEFARAHVAG